MLDEAITMRKIVISTNSLIRILVYLRIASAGNWHIVELYSYRTLHLSKKVGKV